MRRVTVWAAVLVALAGAAPATLRAQASPLPIFDAHVHYNLDIGRPVPVETVFELWRQGGIRGVLLNSRPNDGTRELLAAAPPEFQAVAFARPYVVASDVQTWFRDPAILAMIQRELARGIYKGIGEFHIFGRDADSEGFARFVALASKQGLWLHAHCDDYVIERIFALDPHARVIWAHTGMNTPPARVDELLGRYPTLYGELSYRGGIVEGDALSNTWRALFTKYPERFLLGSDTWVAQRWPYVPEIMQSYRAWLSELPPEVAEKIAWRNGATLLLGQ
ncbi:MAG TPA: amidohydrolase family protein [Burkholderiales bacterium]|nr:amidohydrolase family protein [Burkholderiales bacterium]